MKNTISKGAKRTATICALAGIAATGAFAFLSSNVISQNTNKISATDAEGNVNGLKVIFENEQNTINKVSAVPQTEEIALAETPYTFTVKNEGTIAAVVRLKMEDAGNADSHTTLPKDKIHVVIKEADGGQAEYFKGTFDQLESDNATNGFGKCFQLAGSASKNFKLYAWVDENATSTDLYGSAGNEKKDLQFKMGAIGVQHDGMFDSNDDSNLDTRFDEILTEE